MCALGKKGKFVAYIPVVTIKIHSFLKYSLIQPKTYDLTVPTHTLSTTSFCEKIEILLLKNVKNSSCSLFNKEELKICCN